LTGIGVGDRDDEVIYAMHAICTWRRVCSPFVAFEDEVMCGYVGGWLCVMRTRTLRRFDSSVGRASDWRSEGPWFDPESKHHPPFFATIETTQYAHDMTHNSFQSRPTYNLNFNCFMVALIIWMRRESMVPMIPYSAYYSEILLATRMDPTAWSKSLYCLISSVFPRAGSMWMTHHRIDWIDFTNVDHHALAWYL
jgi:hypothetical protein